MLMHRIVSGLLMLCFLVSCTSNYYFVRHAERANNTADTPLSLEGQQRALALRDSLKDKGIDHIFATIYLRTQQTAIPLSEEIGIPLTIYHPDATQQFVNRLKKIRKKDVLVVGHSNTVPEMVLLMTGDTVEVGHDDYDNLFKVSISKSLFGTRTRLKKLHYGQPD